MRLTIAIAALAASSSFAFAWDSLERMKVAHSIGSVLAAEEFCELTYNQEAIAGHIEKVVPADDMQFAGMLQTMTSGASYDLENMTGAQKAAHCTQIKRVAKSYGFTD